MSDANVGQQEEQMDVEEAEQMDIDEEEIEAGGIKIDDIYIPPPPPPACTFDTTGPRLMLTHIDNVNFKSYAGTQILGPFHKNFTSIVGPNGSGKSNVIDSMLFVFGYRAQKIRSKKITVLIHNSDTHPNVDGCTVTVHFQLIVDKPDDKFEAVPNSQFAVSRTVYKDGTSYYCINGKRSQFKEVAKLLRSHGVDLDHNRFLILQGEVEQIALMKPKSQSEHDTGMLEFLEDIIGCNRFKEPIELLSKKVDDMNEERAEKLNRVKTVEKEKDDLEEAKNEAVEYINLENEIIRKKNSIYQANKFAAQKQEEHETTIKNNILEKMKDVLAELDALKKERQEKEKECKKILDKSEKCAKIVEEKKEQYGALERQDLQCRENLKHSKSKSKTLEKSLETEQQKLKELKKQPGKHEKDKEELEEKRRKLQDLKEVEEKRVQQVMASLKKETESIQVEKDKYEAKLMDLQKTVNETKSKMVINESELNLYLSTEKNEIARLNDISTNYEKTSSSLKEKKSAIVELEKRLPEAELNLSNTKEQLQNVIEEERRISHELREKRLKVEETKSSMQASRSQSKVLEALMRQKESGKLPGILGRLGDLGAIDQKYDIAVSTACGPLDNIVTDTMNTAQKCVEFLKTHNIGVATFIALDKMQNWIPYTKQKIQTPENIPRLFDLINVKNEKVLPAFYFALRDTLVANSLDQATRIGLQGRTRYRVVTLKGELIDLSGTMSGGGGRPSRGRMGQSVVDCDISAETIDEMVRHLNNLSSAAANLKERHDYLEDTATKLQKEVTALKHSFQKHQMEIQALSSQESSLSQQLNEQKEKVKLCAPNKAKVLQMQKALDSSKKDYDKAAEAASEVESEVQNLHSQIMTITEGKIGAAQKKLDSMNNQIDGVTSNITKLGVSIKTAQRNVKKSEDKVASIEEEIKANSENYQKLKDQYKNLEVEASSVMKDLASADKENEEYAEQKKKIIKEINSTKDKENKLNSSHIEVKNELDKCSAKITDSHNKVRHWNDKLSHLNLQEILEQPLEPLAQHTEEELRNMDTEKLQIEIGTINEQQKNMKPNMAAIAEYRKKESQYLQRVSELDEVTSKRDMQRKYLDDIRKQRLSEFMAGFSIITSKLKEMYQMITLGGDAELELVDSLDPFSEGIVFSVRPPKKSWKNISNLSGGEKTLSSLALVFALHYYKPSPLYVMDEIDAALDFKNVSIVGNYIKDRTKNAQFIIISLRNNMFELADRLIGIYKTYNCTKSVTINPSVIAEKCKDSAHSTVDKNSTNDEKE